MYSGSHFQWHHRCRFGFSIQWSESSGEIRRFTRRHCINEQFDLACIRNIWQYLHHISYVKAFVFASLLMEKSLRKDYNIAQYRSRIGNNVWLLHEFISHHSGKTRVDRTHVQHKSVLLWIWMHMLRHLFGYFVLYNKREQMLAGAFQKAFLLVKSIFFRISESIVQAFFSNQWFIGCVWMAAPQG